MKKAIIFAIFLSILILPATSANTAPELKEGAAQPAVASAGDTIVYSIVYADKDGDAPEYVKIYFSNRDAQEMKKVSGDFATGAKYEYKWQTQNDGYDYRFEASDSETIVKFPAYGGTLAPVNFLSERLDNNKIYLFDRQSNKPVWSHEIGTEWISGIAISDDGKYIAANAGSSIYLFKSESSTPLWRYDCGSDLTGPSGGFLIDMSADGKYIVGGCQNSLHLFTKENSQPRWSYEGNASIYAASISADGEYIAAGTSNTDELIFFSRYSNKPLWKYQATSDIHGLSLPADGRLIAAGSHSPEERAYLFSKESNVPLTAYKTSPDSPVWTAAISRDGKYAVYGLDSADKYNSLFLFSSNNTLPIKTWQTDWWARSVDISYDGKYIAAGSGDHNVYLLDKDEDEPLWKFKAGERVGSVSISAGGNYIAAGSKDKNVYLLSKESKIPIWSYKTDSWVTAVAISADGNYIAAGTGATQYMSEGHNMNYNPEKDLDASAGRAKARIEERLQIEAVCGDTLCSPEMENNENCPQDCCPPTGCNYKLQDTKNASQQDIKHTADERKSILQGIIDFLKGLFGK